MARVSGEAQRLFSLTVGRDENVIGFVTMAQGFGRHDGRPARPWHHMICDAIKEERIAVAVIALGDAGIPIFSNLICCIDSLLMPNPFAATISGLPLGNRISQSLVLTTGQVLETIHRMKCVICDEICTRTKSTSDDIDGQPAEAGFLIFV